MKKLRGLLRIIFGRTTFVVLFLLVQMGVLLAGFNWLREYMIYVYPAERCSAYLHYQQ